MAAKSSIKQQQSAKRSNPSKVEPARLAGSNRRSRRKIRYAVAGLGHIAQNAVLPAFKHAPNSELAALISDDQEKLRTLGRRYKVQTLGHYREFEKCIQTAEIDAVYIALPNSLHLEYVLRAADSGTHILCEKPLGLSAEECRRMGKAAESNGIQLMTAYRLHFDPANMFVVDLVKSGKIGVPKIFSSVFSYQVNENNIRLSSKMGGGALFDIGIYAINAARYLFQAEPEKLIGQTIFNEDHRFAEVDGTASAILLFPDNKVAQFTCSFAAADSCYYEVIGGKGKVRLEGAYEYAEGAECQVTIDGRTTTKKFKKHDQFASELIYFSNCILENVKPEPSYTEAAADLSIIREILDYSNREKLHVLNIDQDGAYPSGKQIIVRPPSAKPDIFNAPAPHRD